MITKWKVSKSEILNTTRVFTLRQDRSTSPITGEEHNFYVLEAPEWVNMIAITKSNKLVLIRQFRHGTRSVTLEIPGGMVDPGETPMESARRELLEETGYSSKKWRQIGAVHPNPAIQSNMCHTFLALDAVKMQDPELEGTEDIEVSLCGEDEMDKLVSEAQITHSLVAVAFYWYKLWKQKNETGKD